MHEPAWVPAHLEIDPASDPVAGLVRDRNGRRHDFTGWLQLMAAVEEACLREPVERGDEREDEDAS